MSALEGESIDINDKNFRRLSQLSEEFGFHVLVMMISNCRRLPSLPDAQRVKYQSNVSSLKEQVGQHEHQLAALTSMRLVAARRFETNLVCSGQN
jgi:hypothetical protein